jgi:hypothetical protein
MQSSWMLCLVALVRISDIQIEINLLQWSSVCKDFVEPNAGIRHTFAFVTVSEDQR